MDKGPVADEMSTYEARAWEQSLRRLHEPPAKRLVPQQVRDAAGSAYQHVSHFADNNLPAQQIKDIAEKGMNGAFELTFVPALRSASVDNAVKGYRKKYDSVEALEDIRQLDVREIDRFRRNKGLYVAGSAVQGGATAVAITGTTVSATVSGGTTAGVVVGALATDAVASLALMGRTVGSVAVRYGYDVKLPEEELFAMGVISLGTATSMQARYVALTALSRLTQEMMRQATWNQLSRHALVRVLQQVFKMLGLRLTHRKLAQAVPFAGVAIAGTMNANLTRTLYQRADDIYRIRFLTEKYGLSTEDWVPGVVAEEDVEQTTEPVVDIMELIDEERAIESGNKADPDEGDPR